MRTVFLICAVLGSGLLFAEELDSEAAGTLSLASHVFVGQCEVMPIGREYWIGINIGADHDRDQMNQPDSLLALMHDMRDVRPAWYINALLTADNESCDVIVNGNNYTTALLAWLETNWSAFHPDGSIANEFARYGHDASNYILTKALVMDFFCIYLESASDDQVIKQVQNSFQSMDDGNVQ